MQNQTAESVTKNHQKDPPTSWSCTKPPPAGRIWKMFGLSSSSWFNLEIKRMRMGPRAPSSMPPLYEGRNNLLINGPSKGQTDG